MRRLILAVLLPGVLAAQPDHRAILAGKLRDRLSAIARDAPGVVGVSLVDLTSGERVGVNDTLVFPQGSAIKVAVLVELYRQAERGRLSLTERVPVRAADQVGGSGVAREFGDGTSVLALRDLAVLMIVLSDNTATNVLIDRLGMERVTETMAGLGLASVRLQRRMIQPRESAAGRENVATPADAATLMARLARCELPLTPAHCAEARRLLEIPKSGPFPAAVPPGVRVAWKPGDIEGVATAWGIVDLPGRPYVVVAMVNYSESEPAHRVLREVADAAYAYFARLAFATPFGTRVRPDR